VVGEIWCGGVFFLGAYLTRGKGEGKSRKTVMPKHLVLGTGLEKKGGRSWNLLIYAIHAG